VVLAVVVITLGPSMTLADLDSVWVVAGRSLTGERSPTT
jgi:hypothetical protein